MLLILLFLRSSTFNFIKTFWVEIASHPLPLILFELTSILCILSSILEVKIKSAPQSPRSHLGNLRHVMLRVSQVSCNIIKFFKVNQPSSTYTVLTAGFKLNFNSFFKSQSTFCSSNIWFKFITSFLKLLQCSRISLNSVSLYFSKN